MARRVIGHLDLDAFYASVELLKRPELRGKPVIVSGSSPRAVVTTASYEARRYGVGSAMPAARAIRLCPQAIVIPPDFTAYRETSAQVWSVVREHVEDVEQVGIDEGYLDLTRFDRPIPAVRGLKEDILRRTGLTCSVGIGPNRLIAKVCSGVAKPAGLLALSREGACERFGDAEVGMVPGIGPKTSLRLGELGIRTLNDLRAADRALLVAHFGERAAGFMGRRARFEDETPMHPERKSVSRSAETTFPQDVSDTGEQLAALDSLAEKLCSSLAARDWRGRSIGIKVRLADFTTVTRARTIRQATNDASVVAQVARELLLAYEPPQPVRLLGVRVAAFVGLPNGSAARTGPTEGQLRLPV